jgi:hypothetical protein
VAAQPWYESSLVISAAQLVLGILAIIVTLWVTLYAVRPRHRLDYCLVLIEDGNDFDDLDHSVSSADLKHPKILEIRIRSRGRRDIPSTAFDGGEPILFRVGGRVIAMLGEPLTKRKGSLIPKAKVTDSGLAVGPGLIRKKQIIVYRVLADVAKPKLTVRNSLIDVRMWALPHPTDVFSYSIFIVAPTAGVVFGAISALNPHNRSKPNYLPWPLNSLILSAIGALTWCMFTILVSGYVTHFLEISMEPRDQARMLPLNPWKLWRELW